MKRSLVLIAVLAFVLCAASSLAVARAAPPGEKHAAVQTVSVDAVSFIAMRDVMVNSTAEMYCQTNQTYSIEPATADVRIKRRGGQLVTNKRLTDVYRAPELVLLA